MSEPVSTVILESVGLSYRQETALPWRRNEFWALQDVSFTLNRGDTLGIIGRNGAGKSSLLRVIAGIINPDRGTVTRTPGTRCTMLAFGAGFEHRLTGRQNIMLNGLQLGMDRNHVLQRMDQIVELTNIGEFIDQPVRSYSTGMRARLGFSIAYFIETDIMLIDEALATGDEAFREKATGLIKEKINSDQTVVIVSHSMPMIASTCSRVIQIEHGRSLPELPTEETIERYRNTSLIA
ncbi:MAG: ATP-binding cassette domain-containing protein [Phycisphaerales bacterium]